MRKVIIILMFVAALAACTNIDCPVKNLVYTNYALKKANGTADTLKTDSLWIWTKRVDGTDTLLLNGLCGVTASKFSLQISHTQPEDVFFTLLKNTAGTILRDTFRIKKKDIPHFESVDCQAAYFHELEAVSTTHHALDSITINYRHVNYDVSNTHYHIYFKAQR